MERNLLTKIKFIFHNKKRYNFTSDEENELIEGYYPSGNLWLFSSIINYSTSASIIWILFISILIIIDIKNLSRLITFIDILKGMSALIIPIATLHYIRHILIRGLFKKKSK